MKLILARHGQTEANQTRFVMGRTDSPLTPQGLKTAQDLALVLASEELNAVFSSPLGRAATSAGIYAQGRSLSVQPRPALAELSAGQWEGRPWLEVVGQGTILRSGWTDRPPGGESYQDGEVRLKPFIDELQALEQGPAAVLVVGHAGINRVFLKLWLGLTPEEARQAVCPHQAVYIVEDRGRVSWRDSSGGQGQGLICEAG